MTDPVTAGPPPKARLPGDRRGIPGGSPRRFVTALLVWWLLLTAITSLVPWIVPGLCVLFARALEWSLVRIGFDASRHGTVVSFVGGHSFQIVAECTAVAPMVIFSAGVLAAPADARSRCAGILVGVGALAALNLLRLILLAVAQVVVPSLFPSFHEYVWQVAFAGFALLVFWGWARKAVPRFYREP